MKFFEITCGFPIDKEVSSVCYEGNMHWNLIQRKYMASEKKDGKAFRGQGARCMFFCFFSCITAIVESKKAKAGKRRSD